MRSLTAKLTLAFLLVGLTGAILVAVLVGQRTRSEFDRFLSERDQATLVQALGRYYTAQGSWAGVGDMLAHTPPLDFYSRGIALADAQGRVVIGNHDNQVGRSVAAATLAAGSAVQANGQTVGVVLFPTPNNRPNQPSPPPPDAAFLDRVTWATAISAGIAALIALILGVLLARTLTRPIRELTAATQAMARGKLGQRVTVRSRDEIG